MPKFVHEGGNGGLCLFHYVSFQFFLPIIYFFIHSVISFFFHFTPFFNYFPFFIYSFFLPYFFLSSIPYFSFYNFTSFLHYVSFPFCLPKFILLSILYFFPFDYLFFIFLSIFQHHLFLQPICNFHFSILIFFFRRVSLPFFIPFSIFRLIRIFISFSFLFIFISVPFSIRSFILSSFFTPSFIRFTSFILSSTFSYQRHVNYSFSLIYFFPSIFYSVSFSSFLFSFSDRSPTLSFSLSFFLLILLFSGIPNVFIYSLLNLFIHRIGIFIIQFHYFFLCDSSPFFLLPYSLIHSIF
ncbi:unnamed protein product [Acanthosepion pharaonis]|uniref:Uncharacterized protein n=1 Tax=Acanthosepion pharaonis TaxID=158019 RepID=A0A812B794_ACAPH|nr:unnamed protein product [Sepia pharaonis]